MKFVIQRVTEASCNGRRQCHRRNSKRIFGLIELLIPIRPQSPINDQKAVWGFFCILRMRTKNKSIVGGRRRKSLLISFTFICGRTAAAKTVLLVRAGKPEMASRMYDYIVARCKEQIPDTGCGIFGADMKISLLNDGPFTILLDSKKSVK